MPDHVLLLAPQSILAPTTGAELRNRHLALQLSRSMEVTCVNFRVPRQAPETPLPGIRVVSVPRPATYTLSKLVRGLAGRTPVGVLNYTCPAMRAALDQVLGEARVDFVQIEGIQMAGYLSMLQRHPRRPRAVVCDWHNIESELMRRYSRTAASLPRRLYAWQTAVKLRAAEQRLLRGPAAHLVVSERDRALLLERAPRARVWVVENGVDAAYYAEGPPPAAGPFRVLFVGSMDYHANIEAAVEFARETWPALFEAAPELVFTVVGREPAAEVRALAGRPGVAVTGTVEDVRPYYREALAMVVPLRVGSGTRLKILESMAAGVPVVSTKLGAEGLRAEAGIHFLAAETPAGFRAAVLALRADRNLARDLAGAAREMVRRNYDWTAAGRALRAAYQALEEGGGC